MESECMLYYFQSYAICLSYASTVLGLHMTWLFLFHYVPAVPIIKDKMEYYVLGVTILALFKCVPCVSGYLH